jgi:predicted porin
MLTDKDLEMLRQERHNDYVAEAAREKREAIANADAHTNNAGLPTYSELLDLLKQAQRLGLTFDIGTAYIRRSYIDEQDALNTKINALRARIPA